LGYSFSDKSLLEEALTHSSFANEQPEPPLHNERLEFLGDAVLDLVLSERLMEVFREADEGRLSKLRAHLVNEAALAERALVIGLGDCLMLGRGEELTGGREKPSVLAGAYEALVAAVYLDGGYERVRAILLEQFAESLEKEALDLSKADYKSVLQERCQEAGKGLPVYQLVGETGPDHDKTFEVQVVFFGGLKGKGRGKSKKEAEQKAAHQALGQLDRG
jgi:ribonuclease-3